MKIDRLPEVLRKTGRSKSGHYADVAAGLFSRQVRISVRCVGWPAHEVDALIAARIAGRSDAEIRELVVNLEAARQHVDA